MRKRILHGLVALAVGSFVVIASGANYTRHDDVIIKSTGSIGSGTTPNSKAVLDLVSTTKGFLPPRMTTVQRDAISSPTTGLQLFNSTTGYPNYYNGSSWLQLSSLTGTETLTNKTLTGNTAANLISGSGQLILNTSGTATIPNGTDTLVGKATTDTLTNKTLTAPTITTPIIDVVTFDDQGSTPSTPSAGLYKLYFKTDGTLYNLNPSGVESAVGSSGAGGTNDQTEYISNGKFETAATGWSTYADAASSSPADGTGGSPNVTFSRTTTAGEVLKGTASGELVKGAANRQGEGVAYDFTVDYENYSALRPVYISFDYKTTSNYASSDVKVFVYDKDAAALLTVQDADNLSGALPSATTSRRFTGVFYPSTATSDDYRIIFHITSTNASAYDVQIDSVHGGSAPFIPSSISTDWTSYTPSWTSSGSQPSIGNGTLTGRWRRVGDSMEVEIYHQVGSTTSNGTGNYYWSLPTGYTMDTNKLPTTSAQRYNFGPAVIHDTGSQIYLATVGYLNTSAIQVFYWASSGANVGGATAYAAAAPAAPATGDEVFIQFKVPISGWTSGASLSTNEMLQSTVKASYTTNAGQSYGTGSTAVIDFEDKNYDTHNAVTTGASWKFTAPKAGYYQVRVSAPWAGSTAWSVGETSTMWLRKNGTNAQVMKVWASPATSASAINVPMDGAATLYLTKGDYIDVTTSQASNSTIALESTPNYVNISIDEQPDFSVFSQYNVADRQYTCTLSGPAGWSTTYCFLIPYLTADGTWRARFNFQGSYTSASSASPTMTGVTFSTAGRQAIVCNDNSGGSATANNFVETGSSSVNIDFASNNTNATCSGDVALASKPTMVP